MCNKLEHIETLINSRCFKNNIDMFIKNKRFDIETTVKTYNRYKKLANVNDDLCFICCENNNDRIFDCCLNKICCRCIIKIRGKDLIVCPFCRTENNNIGYF